MPQLYHLTLAEIRDASQIQTDWVNTVPGDPVPQNNLGGVTVAGRDCIVVSTRHNPGYEEMAGLDYVTGITEEKEIQDPTGRVHLGRGISLDMG
jgi:hypothetical protein